MISVFPDIDDFRLVGHNRHILTDRVDSWVYELWCSKCEYKRNTGAARNEPLDCTRLAPLLQ